MTPYTALATRRHKVLPEPTEGLKEKLAKRLNKNLEITGEKRLFKMEIQPVWKGQHLAPGEESP